MNSRFSNAALNHASVSVGLFCSVPREVTVVPVSVTSRDVTDAVEKLAKLLFSSVTASWVWLVASSISLNVATEFRAIV